MTFHSWCLLQESLIRARLYGLSQDYERRRIAERILCESEGSRTFSDRTYRSRGGLG